MAKLEVFDPPMCCSTGVCGPEVDPELTRFAGDLEWLRSRGAEVVRYNLSQEPIAFTQHAEVKHVMDETEGDGLPVIVVDGRMVARGTYPTREELAGLLGLNGEPAARPQTATVGASPMFNEQIAELVALGAAIAANCESCFRYHHRKAVELGIAREDMIEAVKVALRVKEQPAQAMIRLARQHLVPEAAQGGGGCCGGGSGGSCC